MDLCKDRFSCNDKCNINKQEWYKHILNLLKYRSMEDMLLEK